MPSKKKSSKGKRRKAAGRGEKQKQGALDSQMQRLQIADKQKADADEEDAMLEQAIQLAAAEKKEIEKKEKENCTHGFNPSSQFQEHFCKDFMQTAMNEYYAAAHRGEDEVIRWFMKTFDPSKIKHLKNVEMLKSCFLAEGTKCILGGNSDEARIQAKITQFVEGVIATAKNRKVDKND